MLACPGANAFQLETPIHTTILNSPEQGDPPVIGLIQLQHVFTCLK